MTIPNLSRTALIVGITGQDGVYLAEHLLTAGYEVHGTVRYNSVPATQRLDMRAAAIGWDVRRLQLHFADVTDATSLASLLARIHPDEIYNLSAQTHVKVSSDIAMTTANCTALGALRLFDAVRIAGLGAETRVFQASSSEMFGNNGIRIQDETSPFVPCSPYAISKLFAHWSAIHFRNAHDMFVSTAIMFNHESPLRPHHFVSRRISLGVAAIRLNLLDKFSLGNLNATRDWGHASDYVTAMHTILSHQTPDDFILATGESHTVRAFVQKACEVASLSVDWEGEGLQECARDRKSGRPLIEVSPRLLRLQDVYELQGNASRAATVLGWKPSIGFNQLVEEMVSSDIDLLTKRPEIAIEAFGAYQAS